MRDIKDLQPEGNWKICVDHPGHIVYDDGRCWSLLRDRFLIPQPNGTSDYTFFTLNKRKCYVHRLVATNFLENPDGLRDVHHLDSNTKNNHISNLQWLSHKDNCRAKILIDPKERVKTHPNSFIYYNKRDDAYLFIFKRIKFSKRKWFKTRAEAEEFRDKWIDENYSAEPTAFL